MHNLVISSKEKREMDINNEVANSVSLLMFQQGRKSVELAQLLGVSEFTSSRLRSGTTTWKVAYIKVAADWLGVTVTDLTNGYTVVPKTPPPPQIRTAGRKTLHEPARPPKSFR